jgi:tricorn protease interacting factor F2/3
MSSYLLFLGVGKFQKLEEEVLGKKLRLIAKKPKANNHGKFALDFGISAFEYCQDYFRFPYPISKLDLIATKEFLFGAMENWGAIVFKENILLHYQKLTTLTQEIGIQAVIAHEIAHQWFGDLVTPSDFKYLWLNESFATYFGFKTVDKFYPAKKLWERFILSATQDALDRDSFISTVPIELPEEKGISLNFLSSPIIYEKGGSILRQLEYFLGEKSFKEGLRYYLEKFAFNVASSDDFWQSLEDSSNQPIMDLMKSWITEKGHPIINLRCEGNKLIISQELFTYLGKKSDQKWIIPMTIKIVTKNNTSFQKKVLLNSKNLEIHLNSDFDYLIGNLNATGFYHVKYSKEMFDRILKNLTKLSTINRWTIENDYFTFLKAGNIPFKTYSSIVSVLKDDTSLLLTKSVARHLKFLNTHLHKDLSGKIKELGKKFLRTVLQNISIEPQLGESEGFSEIRSEILTIASNFGIQEVIEKGLKNYEMLKNNIDIDANLRESSLIIGAMKRNELDWLLSAYSDSNDEQSRLNYLQAICSITKEELISSVLDFSRTRLPSRHLVSFISNVTQNSLFNKVLFRWYTKNIDYFEQQPVITQQQCLYSIITQSLQNKSELQAFINLYKEKYPQLTSLLSNIEETIAIYDNLWKIR